MIYVRRAPGKVTYAIELMAVLAETFVNMGLQGTSMDGADAYHAILWYAYIVPQRLVILE